MLSRKQYGRIQYHFEFWTHKSTSCQHHLHCSLKKFPGKMYEKLCKTSQLTLERLSPVSVEVEVSATTTQSSSPSFVTFLVILGYVLVDTHAHTRTHTHTHSLSLKLKMELYKYCVAWQTYQKRSLPTTHILNSWFSGWNVSLFDFIAVICNPLFCRVYFTSNKGNKQLL